MWLQLRSCAPWPSTTSACSEHLPLEDRYAAFIPAVDDLAARLRTSLDLRDIEIDVAHVHGAGSRRFRASSPGS